MTATTEPLREHAGDRPAGGRSAGTRSIGLSSTIASEWIKLRSVRSTWIILFLAVALSIGLAAMFSFVEGLTLGDQSSIDPLSSSIIGMQFGSILLMVFSALAVTSEYESRTIRTSVSVTPDRWRLLTGKMVTVSAIGLILSLIMVLGMFFASQIINTAYGAPSAALGDEGVNRFLIVSIVVGGLMYTVIPLSIGFLLRGTASAVTISVGIFLIPRMIASLLPTWVQENVLGYLPDKAIYSLSGIIAPSDIYYASQAPAIIAIIAWIVGAFVIAGIVFNRRDA